MKFVSGLDFGTSNSTLGVASTGTVDTSGKFENLWLDPMLTPLEGKSTVIPSAIMFDFEEEQITFGREAIKEYLLGTEGRLMRSLKSILGTKLMNEKTLIFNKNIQFDQILGIFIKHLKQTAEAQLEENLADVVIGRPVQFVDDEPELDKKAQDFLEHIAKGCGFKNVHFQYEPIAAALDYEKTITKEQTALIVDIGGGTSDFSIVKVSKANSKNIDRKNDILANYGVHIGGTDLDKSFNMLKVMPELGYKSKMTDFSKTKLLDVPNLIYYDLATWQMINFLYNKQTLNDVKQTMLYAEEQNKLKRLHDVLYNQMGHNLAIEVENAKINLTKSDSTDINLGFVEKNLILNANISELIEAIELDTSKIVNAVMQTLNMASLNQNDIDVIFLTGGTTSIPYVKQTILSLFPKAQVVNGDVFGSVGVGLTINAQNIFK